MAVLSAAVLIFLVIDPMGNIPVFISTLKGIAPERQKKIIFREMVIALAVLVIFLFTGKYILSVLQISQASLGIAGSIIIFLIALKMIFSGSEKIFKNSPLGEPFVVPLAVPMVAGPSAISVVILMMAKEPDKYLSWLAGLVIAWGVSCSVLLLSNSLSRILGQRGLTAIERLMGMLLTTVAVEMFISGVKFAACQIST